MPVTFLDLFARWQRPVVLCARTRLGTINHTLLSLHARRHDVLVLGVVFVGEAAPESEAIIATLGAVSVLGRLPWLEPLTPAGLRAEVKPISARITQAMGA